MKNLPEIVNKFMNLADIITVEVTPSLSLRISQLKAYYFHGNNIQRFTIDIGGIF